MATALVPKEIEAPLAHAPVANAFASLKASLNACPVADENGHRWAIQEDRGYAFVSAGMTKRSGLTIALLDIAVEPKTSEADDCAVIAVRRWSKIVDFQSLEQKALQLALTGAARDDRRRARRFLDAFGNGKSELFR